MQIEEFSLERIQSLYENIVEYNLSDSGVHPYSLRELLSETEQQQLLDIELGYGWTNGAVELRQTISALYQGRDEDSVIVTNGSAEANFLMVMSVLEPGDELIVFVPNYLQIWGWARSLGVVVKEVVLREELDWTPDLDDLKKVISSKTKMITICHPNNPTGSLLSAKAMTDLVQVARDHDLYLHADEVYKGSELDGPETPSFADLYEKSIVTNGLSKAMALPGLRLGWLVGPKDVIYKAWQRKDYTSITTSAVSEFVAQIALQPDCRARILNRSKRILKENLALLSSWVERNGNRFSFVPPKAGGMAFVRYAQPINSTKLVHRLREERSILLLPGDVYGLDGYFRVGIGAPAEHLEVGLERLSDFVKSELED
ncbi:aminotransferase class I/II-fold pyridoxal phosphate-dependent enzyme [Kiloniella laminariae]|uniref:Aminotransferase n=1 Tax=Kiloniella laminariae TaxID=454162 RepID=A0ABT4LNU1_9PROT|nr:aminotransferase class I/II-fold pyridoxal phosphate-dependent enzyme [Kiloniella laminariae]MCZ4282749.1 aminotransferase class I/II-fold pyridoxal phosphate-dependent enzyme [Kiloniella laminariae]